MKNKDIEISVDPKVFNEAYLPLLEDDARIQILFGGSSAGKSVFIAQRLVLDLLAGDCNYLAVRNVGVTLRTSVFNEIVKAINAFKVQDLFKTNKSEMTFTCINGYQALLKGLDDVEKIKSITPAKGVITDIWVEEATECKEDDIKQLNIRLRGRAKVAKRMTLSFNPILRTHWIFKKYFSGVFNDDDTLYRDEDQLAILKTTYKDNKFLDAEDVRLLESETDQYWYDVYTLGKWGTLGEVIFKNWEVEDVDPELSRTFDNYKNGLDFGFASDPMAFNRMHYYKNRKRLYILDELHEFGLTNPVLAEMLKPIVSREYVVCDSAEPKSIQELKENGVMAVGAKKGKDSVNFGIQWLQQQEIIIDRKCQNTINEIQIYQWKKNKQGETMRVPVDKDNHHIDDIRYGCEDEMPGQLRAGPWGSR